MTPEQRRRVRVLFEAAIDQEPLGDAAIRIANQAADDPVVRAELLSLLEHHSRAGAFLSQPVADAMPALLAEPPALAPGARVGGYVIKRELGRGRMGRVYLADDERLGRSVALKAVAPHLASDPLERERLRFEARAAARLTHPGICTVYALEEIDGALYVAYECVDGATLADEIRAGAHPAPAALIRDARELAAALAAAHARGVVHRDLKPENVMRARDGRLTILDFGAGVLGTPGYMAPEQFAGGVVDARADVYAFGVLLAEWGGRTTLPPEVAAIIARCRRQSAAERFADAAEIEAALAAIEAPQSGAPPPTVPWTVHQVVILTLYIIAAVFAWQLKEWNETPITVAIFLALGACATIGGVLRGHLVFTERVNRGRLNHEWRRAASATRLLDVVASGLLFAFAAIIAPIGALPAVLALSLGLGIVLARFVLEPATTTAAFGEDA